MINFNFNTQKKAEQYFGSTSEERLEVIYRMMNKRTFSFNYSMGIVGGCGRLERLIADGKIRAIKVSSARNGRWQCNAADVLKHAVIKYRKEKKNEKKRILELSNT